METRYKATTERRTNGLSEGVCPFGKGRAMAVVRRAAMVCVAMACCLASPARGADAPEAWTFVSMPDFLNVDLVYPQKGWEEALDYVLKAVKAEEPDFVLVAGDLVMGRWTYGDKGVKHWGDVYYPAWVKRMNDHGLKFYAALGDHELGDDPWPGGSAKLKAIPEFKKAFCQHIKMPLNGPEHMKGTAWSFVHKGVLFAAVDVFEPDAKRGIAAKVTGKQLAWLDKTLADRKGVTHTVVMGHTPIVGPVRRWSSSGLMLEGGRQSPLWQAMSKRGVDLYLCGEVHDMTCNELDGVQEIAHGGLFGYNSRVNYLVGRVEGGRMTLELKELDIVCEGPKLWQVGMNRPKERVSITDAIRKRGFVSAGRMVVDNTGAKRVMRDKTGRFNEANTPRAVRAVATPPDLENALLDVKAAAALAAGTPRRQWQAGADIVVGRRDDVSYTVTGPTAWGKGGSAWGGGAVQLVITCPKGLAGRLLVRLSTPQSRGNRRMPNSAGLTFEGKPHSYMAPRGPNVWVAFDVTAAQTADGKIVLKMTLGGASIGRVVLMPGR